jgi:NADH-quinone oxidoreductase subunit E/NADP-reducing hydrogenase subunit HndA
MVPLEAVKQSLQTEDSENADDESGILSAETDLDDVCDQEIETVRSILDEIPDGKEGVIPALQDVQDEYGYLPKFALELVADHCGMSLGHVYGTASFYSQFYMEPRGDHTIKVCTGTACHVEGADEVTEAFCDELDVDVEEVTEDGTFTVTDVRCIGACSLAPAVMVGDRVHGNVEPDDVTDVVEEYR